MNQQELIAKTAQVLKPFETRNLLAFIQEVNMKTLADNPKVTFLLVLVTIYAVWRWSRLVILFLFTLLSLSLLIRYTLPPAGTELTVNSTLPFVLGCMGIASVLLYFIFIRTE